MNNHQTNTLSSFLDLFPKLANYAVGFTLLCYLTGFAIANMYLGSLGIINLDVLRTKYILVGLLFLLFIGAIAYLIYGLYQAICKNFEEPTSKLIKNVIWYSLQNLAVLFFAVSSIALLAGSVTALPVGLPKISQSTPWSVWLSVGPQKALASSAALVAIFILTAIIVLLVFILINPKDKDGIKRPRKQQLAGIFVLTKSDFLKALGGIFALFLFSCIFLLSSSLISFLTNNNFSASSNSTDFLSSGWGRYLGGISLIYIVIATFVLMVNLPKNSVTAETDLSFGNPMRFISTKIYLVTLAIAIIMPLYANGIYPNLPQQVGGGQVVKVELIVSDDETKSLMLNPENEIYLIDRTTNNTLFLLVDKSTDKYKVVEIPNASIKSTIYKTSP